MISIIVSNSNLTMDEVISMMDWIQENNGQFLVLGVESTKVFLNTQDDMVTFRLKYGV